MKHLFALALLAAAICGGAVARAQGYAFCINKEQVRLSSEVVGELVGGVVGYDDIITDVFPWHNVEGCTLTLQNGTADRGSLGQCRGMNRKLLDLWAAYVTTRHTPTGPYYPSCYRFLSTGEAKAGLSRLIKDIRKGNFWKPIGRPSRPDGTDLTRTDWRPPTPEEPPVEDGKLYGAFARNSNGDVGWSWDHPTRSEADDAADGKCESHGESCHVFARFHDTCAAYAASSRGAYGWATNKDKGAAESGALGQCRRTGDDSCAVKVAYCMPTDGSSPAAVATTEEAQVSFYGALAAAGPRGAAGWWVNKRTQREADDGAVSECRNHGGGGDCSVVVQFRNACAAYAGDQAQGSSAYGWGIDKDRVSAENRALTECRKRQGSQCRVRVQGCTTRP